MAVIAVVVYHLWPGRVPAGFLGVDLFMVLSGFLITGLLIDERSRAGLIRLGAFWARRFRRLVPALLVLLVGVAVWVNLTGGPDLKRTVRGQGIASLLYVGNWKLVAEGTSYSSLGSAPSPLLHLWSLAIEEQFYVVWPLVVFGVLFLARGRRVPLMVVAALGAVASAVWMAVLFDPHDDPLRLYYGTDTRAQAFLIGALAVLAARRYTSARARHIIRWASVPAFVFVVGALLFLRAPGVLYRGGFAAFALVAAIVVVAVTQDGPVTRVLDRAPLRLVGRVSYGVYLWHWPIIVLVTEQNAPAHGLGLLALRLGLITAATAASWLLVEHPYQRAPRTHAMRLAPVGVSLAALALLLLPTTQVAAYADFDVSSVPTATVIEPNTVRNTTTSADATPASARAASIESPPEPTSAPPSAPPKTVMVIGDSGTYDASPALVAGFAEVGTRVVSTAYPGEGLTRPDGVRDIWTQAMDTYHPDLVIVGLGAWDSDFVATEGWAAYARVVDDTVSLLAGTDRHIVWLSVLPGEAVLPDQRVRSATQNHLYSALPGRFPGVVDYLDISNSLTAADGTTPREIDGHLLRKPDGWHLCPDGAAAVAHAVLAHLGLDSHGWDHGSWRTDARYDNPPGGCPGG